MATLGLCMIVKNEAHVIVRCLESVRSVVDYVLIEDTGSTDGTQEVIRQWLAEAEIPGEVIEEPWRDFAYNRSHVMARLREVESVDYALIIDADDLLVPDRRFDPIGFKAELKHDVLAVPIRQNDTHYRRPQICSNRKPFCFKGVLHEYLESPDGASHGDADGFHIISGREGARSRNPAKYQDDAAKLEAELLLETDPFLIARYRFYLAQSYRDCGEKEKAIANYLLRAGLGYWKEEVFWSLYQTAKLLEALSRPYEEVLAAFQRAAASMGTRAEALHGAARYCRLCGRYQEGYQHATQAIAIAPPAQGLFVEDWIYSYGALDELAVNAYWAGHYLEGVIACERLLSEGKIPADQRGRVSRNKEFASERLQELAADRANEPDEFYRLLLIARGKERLRAAPDEVIADYEQASIANPTSAEALHGAARFCRNEGRFEEGFHFAVRGLALVHPQGVPDQEEWIYAYGLLDELAVTAYWIGSYAECAEACDRLLREGRIPEHEQSRVLQNRAFAAARLAPSGESAVAWTPIKPLAGTELMDAALRERMGGLLDRINLHLNHPGPDDSDPRPRVAWMHHNVDQQWVQWCRDPDAVARVQRFVFVSYWQRERYIRVFGLPPERCVVLRHALDMPDRVRPWDPGPVKRLAYTSTPFRGLSVLLDAWQLLAPEDAELHVWSSMKIYAVDDSGFEHLYERARSLPNVVYHGIAPNAELRAALTTMDFFAYPCTFEETACLAVIEAMAAGCRVIAPSLGALPETTGGYARVYPWDADPASHAKAFARVLNSELQSPWAGQGELSGLQQKHCASVYGWPQRVAGWRDLVTELCTKS